MKKQFLLIAACSIALSASAQQRSINMVHAPQGESIDYATHKKYVEALMARKNDGYAHKTTATGRWYNYVDYFDQNETALSSSVSGTSPYLWGNNMVLHAFAGTSGTIFDTANLVSLGLVTDPTFTGFNNPTYYAGQMLITSTTNFNVDSIRFFGNYLTNPAWVGPIPTGCVDTLRVSFVYGSGAAGQDIYETSTTITAGLLANYGTVGSPLKNQRMALNGSRLTASGPTLIVKDILLDNTVSPPSWAVDTVAGVGYVGKVAIGGSGGVAVPAGNMIGATVSFISGKTVSAYDTVFRGTPFVPVAKYNFFRPIVAHRGPSGGPTFPTYSATDRNTGSFVDSSNAGIYVPHWFWSNGTSAASYQYPEILFHVTCSTCGTVGVDEVKTANTFTVKAIPNPADNELNIAFTLANTANVTVSLTNMLGQVVATQTVSKTTNSKVSFNTAALPSGAYIYTVDADGQRNTGQVTITH